MSEHPVEVARLLQAIDTFSERPPRDLPAEVIDGLKNVRDSLSAPAPQRDTPGSRAALQAAPGTEGTGEHFSKAARGVDGPSPGQREYRSPGARAALGVAALRAKLADGKPSDGER